MRLCQIEIENYGVFCGKQFDFGDGRFHLIYGPNEAGKSTLLELIRELLFGFAVRNPYAFADRAGEMAATVLVELSDGRRLRFRRRKGTKNALMGQFLENDQAVDEAGWTRLLAGATTNLYRQVFGFSLVELALGQESLTSARLGDALYGGGIGGLANFRRVQAEIEAERELLFLPSAKAKRVINALVEQIAQTTAALAHAMIKPQDYKRLCEERDAAAGEEAARRTDRDECHRRRREAERLAQAHPVWLRLVEDRREEAALNVPEGFPLEGGKEYCHLASRLGLLGQEQQSAEAEAAESQEELNRLQLRPAVVAEAAAIRQLYQSVAQIRSCRHDMPSCRHQAEAIRRVVWREMTELNPDWTLADLEQFRSSLAQRDRVERMDEESRELERRAIDLDARLEQHQKRLASDLRRLERLGENRPQPALEPLCRRGERQYLPDVARAAELQEEVESLARDIAQLGTRLAAPFGIAAEALETLPVPLEATMRQFAEKVAESTEAVHRATAQCEDVGDQVSLMEEAVARLEDEQTLPDRAALDSERQRRNALWRSLRAQYLEPSPRPALPTNEAGMLAERYEHAVSEADRLADERLAKAELVARRDQLLAELSRKRQRLAELETRRQQRLDARFQCEQAWAAQWAACCLAPQSPEAMLSWESQRAALVAKVDQCRQLRGKLEQRQRRSAAFEAELAAALNTEPANGEAMLAEAQRQLHAARKAEAQREQIEKELPALRDDLEAVEEALREAARGREDWAARWQTLLTQFNFPPDWDVRIATRILSGLAAARQKHDEAISLDQRVADMESTLGRFEEEIERILASLSLDWHQRAPEEAAVALHQMLEEAEQAERQHRQLKAQYERAVRRAAEKASQRDAVERRMAELRLLAGAGSDAEFEQVAEAVRRKGELRQEIASRERELHRLAAGEDQELFRQQLRDAEPEALALAEMAAAQALETAEAAYVAAAQQAAIARQEVARLDQQGLAGELSQRLESQRAELREAVDRWAPLVIAERLMAEAVARFEREHQPELLKEVSRLFEAMTAGRYARVRRRLDESDTMLVEQSDGTVKDPSQLSTGTREQLYLAIRLAYAKHYCRQCEPLPLVMDDILVNFDDCRANHTLDVLAQVAGDMQVVFLTCHQAVLERVQARLPLASLTRLDG